MAWYYFKKKYIVNCIAAVLLFFTHTTILAEVSPDKVRVKTERYSRIENFKIRTGELEYSISWNGISVASVKVVTRIIGSDLKVECSVSTSSVISLFYTLRYQAYSKLKLPSFEHGTTVLRQTENQKLKYTTIATTYNSKISQREISSYSWKSTKGENSIKFRLENFTLDPLAAIFIARSLKWQLGESKSFDVFDGKTRYLVKLKLDSIEPNKLNIAGIKSKELLVFIPTVYNLNKRERHKKLYTAKIYLSNDKFRDILKLESRVLLGSVKGVLSKIG
jgi:Protein of unknown function (DUF3108)